MTSNESFSDFPLMDMKMIMTFPLPLVTIGYDFF